MQTRQAVIKHIIRGSRLSMYSGKKAGAEADLSAPLQPAIMVKLSISLKGPDEFVT